MIVHAYSTFELGRLKSWLIGIYMYIRTCFRMRPQMRMKNPSS